MVNVRTRFQKLFSNDLAPRASQFTFSIFCLPYLFNLGKPLLLPAEHTDDHRVFFARVLISSPLSSLLPAL